MPPDQDASAPLATFDPPVARAVVTVLRRQGVPARTGDQPSSVDEAEVLVPGDRREEALTLLAARMEEVSALAAPGQGADQEDTAPPVTSPVTTSGWHPDAGADEGEGRPIVMERLRAMGLGIAALLVPLLVIVYAAPSLPVRWALVVFVGGLVAVYAWRRRSESDEP